MSWNLSKVSALPMSRVAALALLGAQAVLCLEAKADFIDDILSGTADSQRRLAIMEAREGRYDLALKSIDKAIAKSGGDPELLAQKVAILFMADKFDEALAVSRGIPGSFKKPRYLEEALAKCLYKSGKLKEALPALERCVKANPGDKTLLETYAAALVAAGLYDNALALIDEASGKGAPPPALTALRAKALHSKGVALARKGDYAAAEEAFAKAVEASPDDLSTLCDRAVALSWAGRHGDAIAVFESLPKGFKAPAYLESEMAKSYVAAGRPAQAEALCRKLHAEHPADVKTSLALASLLTDSGRFDEAIELLRGLDAPPEFRSPPLARALRLQGVSLARAGKPSEGLAALEESSKLSPLPQTACDRIMVLSWLGRCKEALTLAKNLPASFKLPPYLELPLAKCEIEAGDAKEGLRLADDALLRNPSDKDAGILRMKALIALGRLSEASSFVSSTDERKAALAPALSDVLRESAVSLAREGKFDEAAKEIDKAIELSPDGVKAKWDRVVILSWAERHDDAVKAFEALPSSLNVPDYVQPAIAKSYRELSKHEKALAGYKELLAKNPARSDYAAAICSLLASAGGFKPAAEFADGRLKERPEEAASLDKALAEGVQSYAIAMARKGRAAEALESLKLAVARRKGDPKLDADYLATLSWNGLHKEAVAFHSSLRDRKGLPNYALDAVAVSYRELGDLEGCRTAAKAALDKDPADKKAAMNYLLSFIKAGETEKAAAFVAGRERLMGSAQPNLLALLAKAYLEAGKPAEAKAILEKVLQMPPVSAEAYAGMAGVELAEGRWKEALDMASKAIAKNSRELYAIRCRAQALEKLDDLLGAYLSCEELERLGDRQAATDKYRLLAALGANGAALDMLRKEKASVPQWLDESLKGNRAAAMIRRGEATRAESYLSGAVSPGGTGISPGLAMRSRYDSFIASRQLNQMDKILADYEKLVANGEKPPFWVVQSAADAYLYKREPEKALELYKKAEASRAEAGLGKYPDNFEIKMAIYFAYLETEDFLNAGKTIDELDAQINAYRLQRGVYVKNWDKLDVAIEKGWLLVYQDRLKEAEAYFADLVEKSASNSNLLAAQAFLHLFRGWPRRALEDFKIASSLSPNSKTARIGLAYALNENDSWEEARRIAKDLSVEYPEDTDVRKLNRTFAIEEMRREQIDFQSSFEQGQTDGFTLSQRLDQPIYPHRSVYAKTVWMHVMKGGLKDDDVPNTKEVFRNEVGVDWRLYNDLTIRAAGSLDYQAEHPGGSFGFDYAFNDKWSLSADYTSYSLNAPGWVYLANGYAQEYGLVLNYRESEDFNAQLGFDQMFVSKDSNVISEISARQDKAITTSAKWKTRFALEESLTMYTKREDQVAYYSPGYNAFVYAVPYVEHLWYRRYEFSVVDRLYLAPGVQLENAHGLNFAGYVRYEQEWTINDTTSFAAGVTGSLRNYDGHSSLGLAVNASLVFHF